jgi:hypothetical protein
MPEWIDCVSIDPDLTPSMREVYRSEVTQITEADRNAKKNQLRHRRSHLQGEEARLARLLITGNISERTYDQLRAEWREMLFTMMLADLGAEMLLVVQEHNRLGITPMLQGETARLW